jgi:hypothetical protein
MDYYLLGKTPEPPAEKAKENPVADVGDAPHD